METTAVILMAVMIAAQTASLCFAIFRLMRELKQVERGLDSLMATSSRAIQETARLTDRLRESLRTFADAEIRIERSLQRLTESARSVDQSLRRALSRSRGYLNQARQDSDTVLSRFSSQTYRVHQAIVDPALRLAALIRATVVGLRRLVTPSEPPYSHSGDEEIFI